MHTSSATRLPEETDCNSASGSILSASPESPTCSMQDVFTSEMQGCLREKLVGYLTQLAHSLPDAEDLAHVVLIELQAEIENGGPRTGLTFEQWAFGRARFRWIDHNRKARRRYAREVAASDCTPDHPESPDEAIQHKEEYEYVIQLINSLSKKDRDIMVLEIQGIHSRKEIARELHTAEKDVNSVIYRARKAMRKLFDQWRKIQ